MIYRYWPLNSFLCNLTSHFQRRKANAPLCVDCVVVQDVPESLVFLKIYTKGHEVPSDETILSFKRAVHRFLRDNAENGTASVLFTVERVNLFY